MFYLCMIRYGLIRLTRFAMQAEKTITFQLAFFKLLPRNKWRCEGHKNIPHSKAKPNRPVTNVDH
ncbi:MAG: hypothetical protein AMJ61_14345 [Desulfobacterales bacterium SG8_35_2]|jgi:hypothetical protein|nr:MAG: hypothetical protein AMJ61_14345 [Desulfobacterales bacterium SG8_35_2]